MTITERAKEILENYPIYKKMPASLSGKYHHGESHKEHLEKSVNVMKHMCKEFNIGSNDRDMLIATMLLHDIGLYVITVQGMRVGPQWKYYKSSYYSRLKDCMQLHGSIGASVLDNYEIPRRPEIQNLIRKHMSHWYPMEPQPETFYERLVCISDYVAAYGENTFKFKGK